VAQLENSTGLNNFPHTTSGDENLVRHGDTVYMFGGLPFFSSSSISVALRWLQCQRRRWMKAILGDLAVGRCRDGGLRVAAGEWPPFFMSSS